MTSKKKSRPICSYNFKIPSDPVAIIGMVRPMIVDAGGTVTGENTDLMFSIPTAVGQFDGECKVLEPTVVNLTVTRKPEIVSCKVIQKQLTVYITEAVRMYNQQSKAAQASDGVDPGAVAETVDGIDTIEAAELAELAAAVEEIVAAEATGTLTEGEADDG